MREVVLIGITTDIDWQLACEAAKHAELDRKIHLTFETRKGDVTGDVTVSVSSNRQQVTIRKEKTHGRT